MRHSTDFLFAEDRLATQVGAALARFLASPGQEALDAIQLVHQTTPLDALTLTAHGVEALLFYRLQALGALNAFRCDFSAHLRRQATVAIATHAQQQDAAATLLTALSNSGINAVVLKGAALAYRGYPAPWTRPRSDLDLLIAPQTSEAAIQCLEREGFFAAGSSSRRALFTQSQHVRPDGKLSVDLHWDIANHAVFRGALTHDELLRDSVHIPELGAEARGPSDIHALLHACIHRASHWQEPERLIWLYDIYVLAERLTPSGWEEFHRLAHERNMTTIASRALQTMTSAFTSSAASRIPMLVDDTEPSSAFLRPGFSHFKEFLAHLRHTPGIRGRIEWLRELALPSRQFMRHAHGADTTSRLCWAYARRGWSGLRQLFAR